MRKRIGLYCLDQDHRATVSIGIYNYTKQLISAMAEMPDPGFDVFFSFPKATRAIFFPRNCLPGLARY